MDQKDNADIRRALDNLHQMVEVLNDRYRDVRRDRKQLRDRVDELLRERETAEAGVAARLEAADADRARAAELEERALMAEMERDEAGSVIADLNHSLAERNARIAELEILREDVATLRSALERERAERSALEEKHYAAISKLDAATNAEAMARTDSAALEAEKTRLEGDLAAARERIAALEDALHKRGAEAGDGAEAAAKLVAREQELKETHSRLEQRERDHAAALAKMEERLAAAELERERQQKALHELSAERDSARTAADAIREQMKLLDATDDERLKASSARIDELTRDLEAMRSRAVAREHEAASAAEGLAMAEARVRELEKELARLQAAGPGMGAIMDDAERKKMVEQIETAISLIDRHLASGSA